jgi:hypothetical protein
VVPNPCSEQDVQCAHKCSSCVDFESRLKETLLELSSSQLIVKILYKELNEVTTKHSSMSPNTISGNQVCEDSAVRNTCSEVTSKHLCNSNQVVLRFAKHRNQRRLLIDIPY